MLPVAQPGKLNWAATPGLPYYIVLALQTERRNRDGTGGLSRLRPSHYRI